MESMFYAANAFDQNIGSWNVANVVDFSGMFSWTALINQDISGWDVSSATTMGWNLRLEFSGTMEGLKRAASAFSTSEVLTNWDLH